MPDDFTFKCSVCHSHVCDKKNHCDPHSWIVPVIKVLAGKEETDTVILTEEELFLTSTAAELMRKWFPE